MDSDAVNISDREVGDDKGPSLAKIQTPKKRTRGDGTTTPHLNIKQPGHLASASAPSMHGIHKVSHAGIRAGATPSPASVTFSLRSFEKILVSYAGTNQQNLM